MEPEVGDYVYYLPQMYEFKAVVRRAAHTICGVKNRFGTVVALDELYLTTITQRPNISIQEWNRTKPGWERAESWELLLNKYRSTLKMFNTKTMC